MARIDLLVCHLSGTGHLVRTLRLARAAKRCGHAVRVISGGRPLPHLDTGGVRMVHLPPVTIRGLEFGTLRTEDGTEATLAYMAARQADLIAALRGDPPDVLVTETFPLGRRVLATEFEAAIAAVPGALVLASVRDIPEPKPKRLDEAVARLRTLFHGVLVHGDAQLIGLDATWPLPEDLRARVHHVGYLAPQPPVIDAPRGIEVLVSGGGGVLGRDLMWAAAKAAAQDARPWRVLVGGGDRTAVCTEITARHGRANLVVEPVRPDYPDLLARAACSVSLCGYNTAVELAGLRTPAVLVPSTEAGELEQTLRARALAGHPGVAVLDPALLTPAGLAKTVADMAALGDRPDIPLAADDGTAAVRCMERLLEAR